MLQDEKHYLCDYEHTSLNRSRQIGSFVYSTAVLSSDERLM